MIEGTNKDFDMQLQNDFFVYFQYYYNGTTGQYLFWNGTRYQAVNQDG